MGFSKPRDYTLFHGYSCLKKVVAILVVVFIRRFSQISNAFSAKIGAICG
jgi:hypothetical protein